jgi:splicing factor 3A subunit 3
MYVFLYLFSKSDVQVNVAFSGEEVFGKYLDLHSFFVQYCNLSNIPSSHDVDYLQYLDKFNSFFYIPESSKGHKSYVSYVSGLWQYLHDFFRRIQPLVEVEELMSEWRTEFEKKWSAGGLQGWAPPRASQNGASGAQALRLGMFNSVEELEALGLDRLKGALEAMGLKCGGTLSDRASRLWSVRGLKPENYPEKLKAKAKSSANTENSGENLRKKVNNNEL